MLRGALRRGSRQAVVHDSQYLRKGIMQFLDSTGVQWVSKCESNKILPYQGKRIHADELGAMLARQGFRRHKRHRGVEYAPCIAELPGHGPLRLIAVRYSREDEPEDALVRFKYIVGPEFDSLEAHASAQKPRSLHFLVGGPRNRGFS